jgi:hypothetical protein
MEIKGDAKSYDRTTTIIGARYMTKYPKSKIVKFSILIIFAISIVSILDNMPTIEKPMTVCFDTPFYGMSYASFSFGHFQTGDCTLQWANFKNFSA